MGKKKLNEIPTKLERSEYLASGRVTVGIIEQLVERSIVKSFVGKLRGVIVEDPLSQEYKFDDEETARQSARRFRDYCKEYVRKHQ